MDELDDSAVKSRNLLNVGLERKLIIRTWACAPKETRMPSGTIKRLVRDRGFGFIRDDGGQEWFFHRSSVQGNFDQLNEGQRVSFEEEPSAKGPRAGNVRSDAA
jgi:CspA family cold shock protein